MPKLSTLIFTGSQADDSMNGYDEHTMAVNSDWPLQLNDGVVKAHNNDNKFDVYPDTHHFKPREITVKIIGRTIDIHSDRRGKLDERSVSLSKKYHPQFYRDTVCYKMSLYSAQSAESRQMDHFVTRRASDDSVEEPASLLASNCDSHDSVLEN